MIDRRTFVLGSTAASIASLAKPSATSAQTAGDLLPMPSERAAMASAAADFMRAYDVPGLGVAVARKGRNVYEEAFGVADKDAGERLTVEHRFRIASVSKPITAVAVFTLVEQGAVRLTDRPFGSSGILGNGFGSANNDMINRVTIEHLLTHTSGGWGNDAADPMFQRPGLDHKELIAWTIQTRPLQHQPGEHYAYSNFGYCILGRVIEAIARRPYEAFVRQVVLQRAGVGDMELAGNTLSDRRPREVRYHGQAAENPYIVNVRRMDSHGGWLARPAALANFASHVDGFSKSQILRDGTIRAMTSASAANRRYAKGWQVNHLNNWWHNGSLPGTTSIMVRTHSGFCWAALANTRRPNSSIGLDLDKLVWAMVKKVRSWDA